MVIQIQMELRLAGTMNDFVSTTWPILSIFILGGPSGSNFGG